MDGDTALPQALQKLVQGYPGQAARSNQRAKVPAKAIGRLQHSNRVAGPAQFVRTGQLSRAGANHRHMHAVGGSRGGRRLPPLLPAPVQHKLLQLTDGDGPSISAPDAGILTGVGADIGAGALQNALSRNQVEGVAQIAFGNGLHVGLHRHMVGAGGLAGTGQAGLLDVGVAVVQRQLGRGFELRLHQTAEILDGGVTVAVHVGFQAGNHGTHDIIAPDQGLRAHAQQGSAAQYHLCGVLPVGDAAGGHDRPSRSAHLADLIGIPLGQRLQPGTAVAAHADLILKMIAGLPGVIQIDGRDAQPVARAAHRVRPGFIQGGGHLGHLSPLRRELHKKRYADRPLYGAHDLGHRAGLLPQAGACLLGGARFSAGREGNIVGHVGAAHIQLDDIRACRLKLAGHIDPALHALIPRVGNVGHENQVVKHLFCVPHKGKALLEGEALFGGKGQGVGFLKQAVAGLAVDVGRRINGQFDAGGGPAGFLDALELPDGFGGWAGGHIEGVFEGDAAYCDRDSDFLHLHPSRSPLRIWRPSLAER